MAIPPTIDPAATYRVVLTRPAMVAGIKFLPRGELTLRGDMLTRLIEEAADAVHSADPV